MGLLSLLSHLLPPLPHLPPHLLPRLPLPLSNPLPPLKSQSLQEHQKSGWSSPRTTRT